MNRFRRLEPNDKSSRYRNQRKVPIRPDTSVVAPVARREFEDGLLGALTIAPLTRLWHRRRRQTALTTRPNDEESTQHTSS